MSQWQSVFFQKICWKQMYMCRILNISSLLDITFLLHFLKSFKTTA